MGAQALNSQKRPFWAWVGTGAMAGTAANQLLTAGGSEVCAAAACPSGSSGPGGGLPNGCPCIPGYYSAYSESGVLVRWTLPGRLSALRVSHSKSVLHGA